MKYFRLIIIFTVVLLSCSKKDQPLEQYIGIFEEGYIESLQIDMTDEQATVTVESIARELFAEHGVDNRREITVYLFGESTFYFIASFTKSEASKIKNDGRIKELSKDSELEIG